MPDQRRPGKVIYPLDEILLLLALSDPPPGKDSQRLKRMTAAWDDDFLASLVTA